MSSLMLNLELPWSSSVQDDRRFSKILAVLFGLLVMACILVTVVDVPDIARSEKERLPPQLARVLLNKQVLPPPKPLAPPKPEEKKPDSTPEPEKPSVKKPIAPPQPKPQPIDQKPAAQKTIDQKQSAPPKPSVSATAVERARKQAQNSGVMQLKDELAAMREMMPTSALESATTTTTTKAAQATQADRAAVTSGAKATSGGIDTAALSRDTGAVALSGRATTAVHSELQGATKKSNTATAHNQSGVGGNEGSRSARSEEDIRKVMEQHKGAIYSIYNRALRQNAALQGKMVVKLVIDPSGRILEASLVSSELQDPDLEAKILQRIRLIAFPAANVARTTLNQTFDFLPQ